MNKRLHHDFCNLLKFEMQCPLFTEMNYCILHTDSLWLDPNITQIRVISIHCWMVHPGVIHEEQCDLEAQNIQTVILEPRLSMEQAEIQWFPSIHVVQKLEEDAQCISRIHWIISQYMILLREVKNVLFGHMLLRQCASFSVLDHSTEGIY